jgi:6-phosphogluconolactonase
MVEVVRLGDSEAVAREAADHWVRIAQAAVAERGSFSIALSGGSTPARLYELMASEPWRSQVPWAATFVFWGDERRVPASDPQSNYHLASEMLLRHVPIPAQQVFPMDGVGLASSAARSYEDALWRHFRYERREWPRFDLVLLGVGQDGHVASVFPGTRAVSDLTNKVLVYSVPRLNTERITLTLPVLNHARHVLFLVTGSEKAEIVRKVLKGPHQPATYPAQAVRPVDGDAIWLIDEEAAAELDR